MKKKLKEIEPIVLNFNFKKFSDLSKLEESLGKEKVTALKKFIASRKREIAEHFKKDEWDLDFRFIYDDVINHVLGQDLFLFIAGHFVNDDISLVSDERGLMLRKKKRRKRK